MNTGMLQVNTSCSASCLHCPYAQDRATAVPYHWSVDELIQSSEPYDYLLVTGGEPLDHPDLAELLCALDRQRKHFRVATGGHVPLHTLMPVMTQLEYCAGVSFGTDMLCEIRNPIPELAEVWRQNVRLAEQHRMHFSFSITYGHDIDLPALLRTLAHLRAVPSFVMLSETDGQPVPEAEWGAAVQSIAQALGVEVIDGYRN